MGVLSLGGFPPAEMTLGHTYEKNCPVIMSSKAKASRFFSNPDLFALPCSATFAIIRETKAGRSAALCGQGLPISGLSAAAALPTAPVAGFTAWTCFVHYQGPPG